MIDDDPPSREILACILRTAGYLVVAAAAGHEGLRRLHEAPVDLVVTDLQMPDLSGWEVARAVRQLRPGLPVVLVTGNPGAMDARSDLRALVSAILLKPFGAGPLLKIIREVTAAQRLEARASGAVEAKSRPPRGAAPDRTEGAPCSSGQRHAAPYDAGGDLVLDGSVPGARLLQQGPNPDPEPDDRDSTQKSLVGQVNTPAGDKWWPPPWP